MLLALVFTHEAALIFAMTILATLLLRGVRDAAFPRAVGAFLLVMSIWIIVKKTLPPDDYIADVLVRAALHVFDITIRTGDLVLLLFGALAIYTIAFLVLRRLSPAKAHVYAASIVAVALAVYWLWFDNALHTDNQYYADGPHRRHSDDWRAGGGARARRRRSAGPPGSIPATPDGGSHEWLTARAAAGALVLVMMVHAVETAKFVTAWMHYKAAVRALAMGAASIRRSESALRIIASYRCRPEPSVLVFDDSIPVSARGAKFAPARLVVDQWRISSGFPAKRRLRTSSPTAWSRRRAVGSSEDSCLHRASAAHPGVRLRKSTYRHHTAILAQGHGARRLNNVHVGHDGGRDQHPSSD
jgi:hypothetical protein